MADPDLTLTEMLSPDTAEDVLEWMLGKLADAGLPVTDWLPGGVMLTVAEKLSLALADGLGAVRTIANAGLAGLARGAWLQLLARQFYGLTPIPATQARVRVLVSNALGSPQSIGAGQLWMVPASPDGRRWNSANTGVVSVPGGGNASFEFAAEQFGERYNGTGGSYNLAVGASVALATPLPGISIAVIETVPGSGTALTQVGRDEESDAALLQRIVTRWPSLSEGDPVDKYVGWARAGSEAVVQVYIDDTNPDGPGSLRVYLAGNGVALADGAGLPVELARAYILARKPRTATVTVQSAIADAVSIAATVNYRGDLASVQATVAAEMATLQAAAEIGDGAGGADPKGAITLSSVVAALEAHPSVRKVPLASVLLAGSAADYVPAKGHIAALAAPTIAYVAV